MQTDRASNTQAILVVALALSVTATLGGCGGISSGQSQEPTTTIVIVECVVAGTDDLLAVPAEVVVGGVRGQTDMVEKWVILEGVPLGDQDPPQQPVTATAPGYVTHSETLTLNQFSYTAVSLPMTPADAQQTGTVSGTVIDVITGEGVVNALVTFLKADADEADAVTGFTDSDGLYTMGGIPAGEVEVRCQATDYLEGTVTVTVVADADGDNLPVSFQLLSGSTTIAVNGLVLDMRTQTPIPGASVQIDSQSAVTTDAGGQFSLPDVTVGQRQIVVTIGGYDPYQAFVTVTPGMADLQIFLSRQSPQPPPGPYTISGQVTLLGAPDNSGATVTAFERDRAEVLGVATTDADGYYYLFVPPGHYRLEVTYGSKTIGRDVELLGGGRVLTDIDFTLTVP